MTRRRLFQSTAAALLFNYARTLAATSSETAGAEKKTTSFAAVVKRRAMIRAYKSDPVPEEKLHRILEYAVRAPSAGNLQPWEFIVVKTAETRAKLTKAAGEQISVATAPVIIAT